MNKWSRYADVLDLCRKVGGFIQSYAGKVGQQDILTKDNDSLVSFVDQEAEKQLIEGLGRLTPGCSILAEEGTLDFDDNTDSLWIIDPLDGTTNFLHRIPAYAISLAYMKDGDLSEAYIYDIPNAKLYAAKAGQGAFLDDQAIQVSSNTDLKQSLFATGFPHGLDLDLSFYFDIFKKFTLESRGVRRLGSAAIDLAWVAEGRFEGFYEIGLQPWDLAAGVLLVREAGGKVSNFDGEEAPMLWDGDVIAAPAALHKNMLATILSHSKGSYD